MNFKPADFFLGIVDFLGMMVPGAVLVFLEAEWICRIFGISPLQPPWLVFAAAAYLLGHLLLAATESLNWYAMQAARKIPFLKTVQRDMLCFSRRCRRILGQAATINLGTTFHAALSFLRLQKIDAVAEIDRHMAGYKLLRNLVAVFFVDLLLSLFLPQARARISVDFALMLFFFLAFARMLQWAYLLAFQYCILIDKQKPESQALPPPATKNR